MSVASQNGGGSFRELRDRHLFLFEGDRVVHFHQRGRADPVERSSGGKGRGHAGLRWQVSGIFHYRTEDGDEDGIARGLPTEPL